jgi:uncharacterized protein YgiM (DUF1202 family)
MREKYAAVLGLMLVVGIGVAFADEVLVEVESLVVRAGKGSMYEPVGEVPKDARLEVIERQPKGWLKVKVGDQEGYVKETALKPRDASLVSGLSAGANAVSGNTSDVGATAAGRGINDDAAVYATSNNYSTAALEQMIANRDRVVGDRWVQFTNEGKVGPAKP